jgi:hypothetical protein
MSPEAIDRRLREVAQLFKLGKTIREAKRLGKASEIERDRKQGKG